MASASPQPPTGGSSASPIRSGYRYRGPRENQLHPIASAGDYPWSDYYSIDWMARMGVGFVTAQAERGLKLLRYALQYATFRFDKMKAFEQLFLGPVPKFVKDAERDEAFAWRRVAGPNALSLEQVRDSESLSSRIAFDGPRIEARLAARLERPVSLADEALAGRLFVVDFRILQESLRPGATRDSRWRAKYLPAPIGLFLEAPGFHAGCDLVPLAIQIDQPQPDPNERNPVYYPDDAPDGERPPGHHAWQIAKLFFEVADLNFHVGCGHVFRTHLAMEPFALATPRRLPEGHPVHELLRPHLRFTLPVNRAAYKYFTSRKETYFEFYAGTLEETRQISIQSYLGPHFVDLRFETEIASRGVTNAPADYPYRDDGRLWLDPLHDFTSAYVRAFYASDAEVAGDAALQAWAAELVDPAQGAVRELVPGNALDGRETLAELLAQILFIAGPGHASQHFSSNYFYRYPPAHPGAAYTPPVWEAQRAHEARWQNSLPPITTAAKQYTYNSFTDFQYDVFGDYGGYPLGRMAKAAEPIRQLQEDLGRIEQILVERQAGRLHEFGFFRPSRVPNSINI